MSKIKEPSIANSFYPANADILKELIENFELKARKPYSFSSRAVIVPHAGLVYSGLLAFEGINQLDKNVKNIFIIAPSHRRAFEGLSLSSYDQWSTPLGNLCVNKKINEELIENFNAQYNDEALAYEHSIEIELPLIQYLYNNDIQITPILVGQCGYMTIEKIIEKYYGDKNNAFIISSDLSHFMNSDKAQQTDNKTAQMIETRNYEDFQSKQACGAIGIIGLVEFANKNNYSLIRIDMANSSRVTHDETRVVGYGCWFLYEGIKNEFIKKYYRDFVIKLAKDSINVVLEGRTRPLDYDIVFDEFGACFVTLKKNGQLRGCIGSILAYRTLVTDIIQNSKNAAFRDPRFNPVVEHELNEIKVNISLLSIPKKIVFEDEADLLNKIEANKDGIIIQDKSYRAVYLPSVWEDIPDKTMFLNSLKVKAGLKPEHFSKTFEAYKFEAVYIEEK